MNFDLLLAKLKALPCIRSANMLQNEHIMIRRKLMICGKLQKFRSLEVKDIPAYNMSLLRRGIMEDNSRRIALVCYVQII